jgi:hypothetical protein
MPAAIEKNAVAEEMSRMRGRGLEAHYNISRTLRLLVTFRNNTLAGSQKERRPYERLSCFACDGVNFQLRK